MQNRFKRFLLIFMMLALPVQAFASVAVLGCEFARIDAEMQAAVDMPAMNQSMDRAMSGCHEAPAEKPDAPAGEHKCSHCAACYLAAAFPIPATAAALLAPVPYSPHLQTTESFSGFVPEGPERPPRTSLA